MAQARLMKRLLFVLAFVCLASTVHAQTATALWNQSEAPAVANALTATLQVDTSTPIAVTPTCVAAVAPATGSTCSAPFTLVNPTAAHTYTLSVCNAFGCASGSTSGLPPGMSGFKIKVTVIIGGDDED